MKKNPKMKNFVYEKVFGGKIEKSMPENSLKKKCIKILQMKN